MPAELIVNADDFGLCSGVNRGVVESFRSGIVTSASLLANGEAFEEAVSLAAGSGLPVGVHLNLTRGAPLLPPELVPSLVTAGGGFRRGITRFLLADLAGLVDPREAELEWRAQIKKVLSAGLRPSHLDGEQYVHLVPGLFGVCAGLAAEFGITRVRAPREIVFLSGDPGPERRLGRMVLSGFLRRARPVTAPQGWPERLLGFETSGRLTPERLLDILRALPEGLSELVCHPGDLPEDPAWGYDWRGELRALTSSGAREALTLRGARLRN